MELDASYWNSRYEQKEIQWDIGHPSDPLEFYIHQIEDPFTRILIPGCGNAYEGELLWNLEFEDVTLLDFAPESKENFLKRVPDFPAERFIVGDFFEHQGEYDLILEQTFFCALPKDMRKAYAEKMFSLLAPGGKVVGVLFNDKLNEDHPPFGGSALEYLGYFQPVFNKVFMKPCYNSIEPRMGRELFIKLLKD